MDDELESIRKRNVLVWSK